MIGEHESSYRRSHPFSLPDTHPYIVSMTDTDSKPKPCPICGKPAGQMFRPFCSRRCADVDLHRWLSGAYAVPAVEADELPEETDKEPG